MKARIKQLEDLPDYLKCCPQTIELIKPFVGMTLSVSKISILKDTCPFCGSIFETKVYNSVELRSSLIPIDSLDIDESGE